MTIQLLHQHAMKEIFDKLSFNEVKDLRRVNKWCSDNVIHYWQIKRTIFKLFRLRTTIQRNFDICYWRDREPLFYVNNIDFFERNKLVHFFIDYPCPTMLKRLSTFAETLILHVRGGCTVTSTEHDCLKSVNNGRIIYSPQEGTPLWFLEDLRDNSGR